MSKKESYLNFFIPIITFFFVSLYGLEFSNIRSYFNKEKNVLEIKVNYTTTELIIKDSLYTQSPQKGIIEITTENEFQEVYSHSDKKYIRVLPFEGEIKIIIKEMAEEETTVKEIPIRYKVFYSKNNKIEKECSLLKITSNEAWNKKNTIPSSCKIEETMNREINNKEVAPVHEKKEISIEKILLYAKNFNFIFVAFLVLILGIIMSFTPCIYPMIPITIAILGIDKQPIIKRIISATLYICGIAVAFSLLGLLASSGQLVFGSLFQNSFFVGILIIFLTCMILNMLDISNISFISFNIQNKIPESIQKSNFLPFFYGIFSGTISSPCVSPGLFALLTLVAEQGNLYIGWLWLFCFGIGLGLPLWIVAVLFGSENFLLKSGMWMIEIKEIFALLLLLIIYKHSYFLLGNYSIFYILLLFLLFCLKKYKENNKRSYWFCSWSVLVGLIIVGTLLFNTYKKERKQEILDKKSEKILEINWLQNIEIATKEAKETHKTLLIDFTADWCTACKILNKKLFENTHFINEFSNKFVFCKIDCTNNSPEKEEIIKKFGIYGLPTIVLITEEGTTKKFGSELDADTIREFVGR
jgi:thiol:disulfide interchange protein DsbD